MDTQRQEVYALVGSDLHNSEEGLEWFFGEVSSRQPGLAIMLGDFTTEGPVSFLKELLISLRHLAPRSIVIPGNWDPRESLVEMDIAAHDGMVHLHKKSAFIDGWVFAGLGGSTTTPIGTTPLESPDEGFADAFGMLMPADAWVLHNPVYGFCDKTLSGENVGSEALFRLWKQQEQKPRLVMSGHIHEAVGVEEFGATTFVNPGTLKELSAAEFRITENSLDVRIIKGN